MCAVIAHALAVIRRDVFGRECDPNECAAVALYHDCSEILTGDLPTPIKYHNALIRDAYREVEDIACARLIETLPAELRGAYEPLLTGETAARTHDIVKAADKLSAYIKCIEERRAGNDEFISAEKQTRAALERCSLPQREMTEPAGQSAARHVPARQAAQPGAVFRPMPAKPVQTACHYRTAYQAFHLIGEAG